MLGKKFWCLCTGLLCCAMTMSWTSQRAVGDESSEKMGRAVIPAVDRSEMSLNREDVHNSGDPGLMYQFMLERFGSDGMDELIQKFGTDDPVFLFEEVGMAADGIGAEVGAPRGGAPANDACANAEALAVPASVTVDTTLATTDTLNSSSCAASTTAPRKGVWYSVVGDGTTYTVSTCNPGTFLDTVVQVFCGNSCSDFTCVNSNDDFTANDCFLTSSGVNRKSRLSWCTAVGQTYLIHVGAFTSTSSPQGGPIELTVTSNGQSCTPAASCTPVLRRCCYWDSGSQVCADLSYGACVAVNGVWGTSGSTCATACPTTTGRCCYISGGSGLCAVNTNAECWSLGGLWVSGSTCATGCPQGRCCYVNGGSTSCIANSEIECTALNGYWTSGSTCATACPTGRCCYLNNGASACVDNVTEVYCEVVYGGLFTSGSTCATACTTGRCCYLNNGVGACASPVIQGECLLTLNGTWTSGSTCATACPTGRCCYLDNGVGACAVVQQAECTFLGGTWTSGSTCATACPTGRCCYNGGNDCAVVQQLECTALGGTWASTLTCSTACPTNDTCATATPINCGDSILANLLGAGNDYGAVSIPCTGFTANGPDLVYSLTLTSARTVTVSMVQTGAGGTTFDASLYVVTNCSDINGTCLAGSDLCCSGVTETITWFAPPGTYYIIADAFTSAPTNPAFFLNVTCAAPGACCLPGGGCSDVADAAACAALSGTYLGADTECSTSNCATGACCHGDGTCTDGALESECDGLYDTFSGGGSCASITCSGRCCYYAIGMSLCENTNQLACEDLGGQYAGIWTANLNCGSDPCPTGRCCYDIEGTDFCEVVNQDACNDLGGTWTQGAPCTPDACLFPDTCEDAIAVNCGDVVQGTLVGANNNYNPAIPGPSCTGFAAVGADVVYKITSPFARNITILMDPSPEFDAALYVVTNCNDMTTCVAGADSNVTTPGDETLTFAAAANVTYYIICDKFGASAGGPFTLSIICPIEPCGTCPADLDGNGRLDGRDVQLFTDCVVNSLNGIPPAGCGCADADESGLVDLADVTAFANILVSLTDKFCGDGEGRCCINSGASCVDGVTAEECAVLGGNFAAGLNCTANPCPVIPDDCTQAIAVGVPSSTVGDNTLATDDAAPAACGVSTPNQGVWYKVTGTGNTIRVSTCNITTNFDTMLEVFCGECGSLICVGGNDDTVGSPPDCALGGLNRKSTFTWCSALNTVYYIRVSGFSATFGIYQLDVSDDGVPCANPPSCTPPIGRCCYQDGGVQCSDITQAACNALSGSWNGALNCGANPCTGNDTCATATPIVCGAFVAGSTVGASNDYNPTAAGCTGFAATGPDVVYSFTAASDALVSVLMDTSPEFDASLYVVTNCADVLGSCVAGADDNVVAPGDESLSFVASTGTTYYIICDGFGTANGTFNLSVSCVSGDGGACCDPDNGTCTDQPNLAACDAVGGVFQGALTTCATTVCPQPNPTCETAIAIDCDTFFLSGSNIGAGNNYDPTAAGCTGYAATGPDVVYSFTPTADTVMTVTMTPTAVSFDGSMYVVTDCFDILGTCVAGSDNFPALVEQVTFAATTGITYYIIVDAFSGTGGTFDLVIECDNSGGGACCAPNGVCTVVPSGLLCPNGYQFEPDFACEDIVCVSCVNCTDNELEGNCGGVDNFNGGCNSVPVIFSPIACNDSVCGTAWADGGTRDTDWYEVNVATASNLNWSATADFDFLIAIVDASSGCANLNILASAASTTCQLTSVNVNVGPGTYWVLVLPSVFEGYPCAGGPWNYTATLACTPIGDEGACCTGEVCTEFVTQADCLNGGGTYLGLASDCIGVDCNDYIPITNDECVDAIDITANINGAAVSGNNTTATANGADPLYPAACHWTGAAAQGTNTVWYKFTAPANGSVTVQNCASAGTLVDGIIAVLESCAGPVLACDDDGCTGAAPYYSTASVTGLTPGNVYYVKFACTGGWTGSVPGSYDLVITSP
ncbi:MAG: hypothetical protein KF841_12100 [Phycisphaerae bacterium]|nr:hypothetical protein [Phycisphaerae bacterium]